VLRIVLNMPNTIYIPKAIKVGCITKPLIIVVIGARPGIGVRSGNRGSPGNRGRSGNKGSPPGIEVRHRKLRNDGY
jgi:hypothetical protein